MKKICWFTADSFVDCDWIPIDIVSREYYVEWVILQPADNPRYKECEFYKFAAEHKNVHICFYKFNYSIRDIRRIIDNYRIGRIAQQAKADIYYVNFSPNIPWFCFFWHQLPRDKKIITAHQGAVHVGMNHKKIVTLSRKLIYSTAPVVNMFSKSQAELFKKTFTNNDIKIIKLALKDYGAQTIPVANGSDPCVKFLLFGILNFAKNVDLLIDAACNLYEHGIRGFKVLIYGSCQDWSYYKKRIRYPEIFEISIGFVDNDAIPNLLAQTHFFIQPYRVVSQSGAMKVAFQYNTPVIVSNLAGFIDELEEGTNGFSFKVGDVEDLERLLKERIVNFHKEYDALCTRMRVYTQAHYSAESIGKKYVEMFDEIK